MPRSARPFRLTVRLSIPPGLGAARLGYVTKAVRTADPSAHGRSSAAIHRGISSRRVITCFKLQNNYSRVLITVTRDSHHVTSAPVVRVCNMKGLLDLVHVLPA